MNATKVIETKIARLWVDDEGIGHVVFLPNTRITLEAAKEYIAACAKQGQGRKLPVLVDLRNVISAERAARQFLAGEEVAKITKCSAVIVGSPLSKMFGNFFIGLNRPPFPTKLFTSEIEAIAWLKGN